MPTVSKFTPRYRAETSEPILSHWDNFVRDDVSAYEADWVSALRKRAHGVLVEQGLPTQKLERFKYINLPSWIKKNELKPAKLDMVVDGYTNHVQDMDEALQSPADWVKEMLESVPAGEPQYGDMMLWHLSNAYLRDGVVVDIPANEKSETPLNFTITGHDENFTTAHHCIRVGANADITIIEYHMGAGAYLSNALTQIKIAKNARVRHYRFQENSEESAYIQNSFVELEEGATYEGFTLTNGAGISRHQAHANLIGKAAECHFNGVNLLNDKQIADTTITVEHQAPACISKQNYRNVLTDKAIGVFQGKVHVHQVAQQTDGYQKSDTLLLSGEATMNTKPELEIYADDVKCSHGTTAGRMDDNALFYLRSRGIPEKQARALLIEAFINQAMEEVTYEPILEQTSLIIQKWLAEDMAEETNNDWVEG